MYIVTIPTFSDRHWLLLAFIEERSQGSLSKPYFCLSASECCVFRADVKTSVWPRRDARFGMSLPGGAASALPSTITFLSCFLRCFRPVSRCERPHPHISTVLSPSFVIASTSAAGIEPNITLPHHLRRDTTLKRIHDEEQGHGAYRARAMSVDLTGAASGRTPPGSRGAVRETG